MDVTRLGHAALLVESNETTVLIDPGTLSQDWHGLTGLDAILITHQHADHFDQAKLAPVLESNPEVPIIAEPAVAEKLAEFDATPGAVGESIHIGGFDIEIVGGEHALIHERVPRIGNIGFVIAQTDGPRLFHPGDSYATTPSGIDLLALPITAPWSRVGNMVDFLNAVNPGQAIPIHDSIVSDNGREIYMRMAGELKGESIDLADPGIGDRYEV
jgi:L-ascorbate metabolism protein UlaG (beta-lactamase superfamily)